MTCYRVDFPEVGAKAKLLALLLAFYKYNTTSAGCISPTFHHPTCNQIVHFMLDPLSTFRRVTIRLRNNVASRGYLRIKIKTVNTSNVMLVHG